MSSASYRSVRLAENVSLAPHTFILRFDGCSFLKGTLPGQFVMLRADGWGTDPLLPRAFSLLGVAGDRADILIKAAGKASARLEHVLPGEVFSMLGPLGNAFPAPSADRVDFLVAGGVGLAPLLMQAQAAGRAGHADRCHMFYGGRSQHDLVCLDTLRDTGAALILATEDGSAGQRGYVTTALDAALERHTGPAPTLLCCGPDPMLEAAAKLARRRGLDAHLSLEGEMACGVGACLVCAVPCASRPYRYTCVDGPVFPLSELRGRYAEDRA